MFKVIKDWLDARRNRRTFEKINKLMSEVIQIEILGKRKRGKSLLILLICLATHYNSELLKCQNASIDFLRDKLELGSDVLEKFDTVVWSNGDFFLNRDKTIKNNFVNWSDFGLPGSEHEIKYIPAYSLVAIDELQAEASSQRKTVEEHQLLGAQFAGHNNYKFLFSSQRLGDVTAKFKELSDLYLYVRQRPVVKINRKGEVRKVTLKTVVYSEIEDAMHRTRPRALHRGDIADRICKYQDFTFYGDIFSYYNPYVLRLLWLRDLELHGYHQSKLPDISDISKPVIKQFCKSFRCFKVSKVL